MTAISPAATSQLRDRDNVMEPCRLIANGAGRICVIAERLKPESLFRQFITYRESLGMEVVPHSGGPSPFGVMARRLRAGRVVGIFADRDLSTGGLEVSLFCENARVGAGPAGSVNLFGVAATVSWQARTCAHSGRPAPRSSLRVRGPPWVIS